MGLALSKELWCSGGPHQIPGPAKDSHLGNAESTRRKSIAFLLHASLLSLPVSRLSVGNCETAPPTSLVHQVYQWLARVERQAAQAVSRQVRTFEQSGCQDPASEGPNISHMPNPKGSQFELVLQTQDLRVLARFADSVRGQSFQASSKERLFIASCALSRRPHFTRGVVASCPNPGLSLPPKPVQPGHSVRPARARSVAIGCAAFLPAGRFGPVQPGPIYITSLFSAKSCEARRSQLLFRYRCASDTRSWERPYPGIPASRDAPRMPSAHNLVS
eukprot:2739994-Amphidinium_carterae.1